MIWVASTVVLAVIFGAVPAAAEQPAGLAGSQAKFDPPPDGKAAAAAQKNGAPAQKVAAPMPKVAAPTPKGAAPAPKGAAPPPKGAPPPPKSAGPGAKPPPPPPRQGGRPRCLSQNETRETVSARKLSPPFSALRTAGSHARGETIGVRLCRHNDEYFYEIHVLRRDGRVVKVIIDAPSGKVLRTVNDR